ncbi:MAG: chloride channel protein [Parafilimonas sp.]|nr:chloride channel protein [Parafilimonas sp.]
MKSLKNVKRSDAIPISLSLDTTASVDALESKKEIVDKRVFYLSLQAVVNAMIIGLIAKFLVLFINFFTNLSFYGKFSLASASPANNQLGLFVIFIPVIGGLIVGIMARFGSAAIRGHGIPEAMEQVLTNESKIKPVITFLKPISAAISIGTGGPFGAEGPIISTGGALGSVAGQIMHITASERKVMLTAGATAGMAAIFGTPLAAVLLAIELLLFEFSPRSIIPVALACVTGAGMHFALFGTEAVFAMPNIPEPSAIALVIYILLGAAIGVIAAFVSKSIYLIEDAFEKLPVHWMWWPAIGAVAVGVVGYFAPYTLGVGYSNISALLSGSLTLNLILGLCFLKFLSWSISLGSGTSGGTLAPLLTIGGAFGILLGMFIQRIFPESDINLPTCALIGMASMFAGASRALLTSIVFAFESTMQPHGLLPLLGACIAAYFVSFFLMKHGTIMTEKINRRGVFTPNAYEADILQRLSVGTVMQVEPVVLSGDNTVAEVKQWVHESANGNLPKNLAVVDDNENLIGIIILRTILEKNDDDSTPVSELVTSKNVYVYDNSQLSFAVDLMHRFKVNFLPVVDRDNKKKVIGVLTPQDVFGVYRKRKHEEDIYKREISLRRRGYKLIVRGKQLLQG